MQAGPAPIPVYRPSYLTDGLEFQGSLVESPANVFYQRVSASRANISTKRARIRAVGDSEVVRSIAVSIIPPSRPAVVQ